MPHLKAESHLGTVPAGLKERWEEFASDVRRCWANARKKYPKGPTEKLFGAYMSCMRTGAYHDISYSEAVKAGIEPHPICVLAKEAKGLSKSEAEEQCLREGSFHGISVLGAKIKGLV